MKIPLVPLVPCCHLLPWGQPLLYQFVVNPFTGICKFISKYKYEYAHFVHMIACRMYSFAPCFFSFGMF